jgi:hypothetical protein
VEKLNKQLADIVKYEQLQKKVKELEKLGDRRTEEQDDEYFVARGRLEKMEHMEGIVKSLEALYEYSTKDLSELEFPGRGHDEDGMKFLPDGRVLYREHEKDFDEADNRKYRLVEAEEAREILEKAQDDLQEKMRALQITIENVATNLEKLSSYGI